MAPTSTFSLLLLITLVLADISTLAVPEITRSHTSTRTTPLGPMWVSRHSYGTPLSRITLLLIPGATSWTHSGGPYGENLYDGYGDGSWTSPEAAVDSWVSEKIYYDEPTNTCSAPEGESCLHYTQVVWSSTTDLGCASVPCQDGSTFILCSYYPPGNWDGERPY